MQGRVYCYLLLGQSRPTTPNQPTQSNRPSTVSHLNPGFLTSDDLSDNWHSLSESEGSRASSRSAGPPWGLTAWRDTTLGQSLESVASSNGHAFVWAQDLSVTDIRSLAEGFSEECA
jgi:hypothetical protein